ncbi:MAG: Hsp20 family protein [Hydrogenibacillus sp.]|nr:Hsp20 family protein [Hydrogenibacillus sp.]
MLSITLEQSGGFDEEREQFVRKERYRGRLERHFALENVDAERIKAKFKDGLLTVTLPKLRRTPPSGRRIDIE